MDVVNEQVVCKVIYDYISQFDYVEVFFGLGVGFVFYVLIFVIVGVWGEMIVYVFEEYDIYILIISVCLLKKYLEVFILVVMKVLDNVVILVVWVSLGD